MAAGWWVAHGDGLCVALFICTWQFGALEGPRCPSKWACLSWFLIRLWRWLVDLLPPPQKKLKGKGKKEEVDSVDC